MHSELDLGPYDLEERSDGWAIIVKQTRAIAVFEGKEMRGMSQKDASVMARALKARTESKPSGSVH